MSDAQQAAPALAPDAILLSYPYGGQPTARTARIALELHAIPVMKDGEAFALRFCDATTADREYRITLTREAAQTLANALAGVLAR